MRDKFDLGDHIPVLKHDFSPEELRQTDEILAQMLGGERYYPGDYFDGLGPNSTGREPDPQGLGRRSYKVPIYDVLAKIEEILGGKS